MYKFLRKYHKWISIIFSFFFLLFGLSGIILNHREWLAPIEINRNYLPKNYQYNHWNLGAVKGTLKTSDGKILIYGNIGIWETTPSEELCRDLNQGLKKGIDNRKISTLIEWNNQLIAAAFSGLYVWKEEKKQWQNIPLPVKNAWIMDLVARNDSLYVLTRSELLTTMDLKIFNKRYLPPPENYDNRMDLFKTLWVIHSGEIYGLPGKILVDLLGIALIFLTLTGLKIFIDKMILKNNHWNVNRPKKRYWISWNLRWHNKIGYLAVFFLLINSLTGIFLRPPFLIIAAGEKVKKIPYTELDTPNAWFDQLRRIHYDSLNQIWVLSTYEGFYYSPDDFRSPLRRFIHQPPASVMGVNVLEQIDSTHYLIGSFEGLYQWNFITGECLDFITGKPYEPKGKGRAPIGDYLIRGYSTDFPNHFYVFDYNRGCIDLATKASPMEMPEEIKEKSPLSLWSLALEIHTGRIYQSLLGPLYILVVPLTGLAAAFELISGFILWWKYYRRGSKKAQGASALMTSEEPPSPASLNALTEK
ncbi:MAG: PepSY-associated TM helix domain-containing protein [Bacteroidales bacterium]